MTLLARRLSLSVATFCVSLAMAASPALAATHHKHHAKTHHVARHASKSSRGSAIVRIAQQQLSNLGYYTGSVDGVMGAQTKLAIKKFQREHGLKADGVLGSHTRRALESADHQVIGTHSQFMTHDSLNAPENVVHQDYATSLNGGTKPVSSRFARLDVTESGVGAEKHYSVNVNGQPMLTADGQPSVIGISPTYDMGDEDAVIFTTYSPTDMGCMYRTHVLAMSGAGTQLLDIDNCTHSYDARVTNGSLYITFPEHDDARAVGATWRVEGMRVERL